MSINILKIIEIIKAIKGLHTDVSVADCLNISRTNLAVYKQKSRIPYKYVLSFCEREGISANLVFFGRESQNIEEVLYYKIAEILVSDTIYKDAMINNIEAFHAALCERKYGHPKTGLQNAELLPDNSKTMQRKVSKKGTASGNALCLPKVRDRTRYR